MIKKLASVLICIFIILSATQTSIASHGMGGEITWQCLPSGEFKFTLKFYRDCNGINAPATINLTTTVPGVPSIPMPRTQYNDVSPTGLLSNGVSQCVTCASPGGNIGIIEEHIYESAPVFLNGVPPATGWDFYWGECCRSFAVSNIQNPGSMGFRLKATMFDFNGQNMNPCFDSSPYFIERPLNVVCTGLPVTYQHIAGDAEFDSLSYEFTNPLSDNGSLIQFEPGYSVNQPLPGTNVLDPFTGEYFSNSQTGGYFAAAIKVKSYKCGLLVSENTREVHLVLNNSCPPILGGGSNQPPVMTPPFQDSITGLYTLFSDTVFAGDTVNFQLSVTDFDLFTNTTFQTISYNSYGTQYGAGFTDPSAGCVIPPCATLAPPAPISSQAAVVTNFNWVTAPQHTGYSYSCVQFANTHYFMNKSKDNYCPANATEARVFSITVLPTIPQPPVINNLGVLTCPWGSNYTYQWFLERNGIPGATADTYTPVQPGNYRVLAVAPDGNGNYSEPYFYNPVGIYEYNVLANITVVPNPSADGIFNLELPGTESLLLTAIVTDLSGRVVLNDELFTSSETSSHQLNLSAFTKGVYILRLESEGGFRKMMKLVVQ